MRKSNLRIAHLCKDISLPLDISPPPMLVLVLGAPMTGRTWLVDELVRHNLKCVDLDAIFMTVMRQLGLDRSNLPVVGMPNWYERVKKSATNKIPTDAEVYVGGSSLFPFIPPFLDETAKNGPVLKLFLRVHDLDRAYRRLILPELPANLHQVPTMALKNMLSAVDTNLQVPYYENFCARYFNLGRECAIHMTAQEIVDHLRQLYF